MIRNIIRYCRYLLSAKAAYCQLKWRFFKADGIFEQKTIFLNPECIEIGRNVRIKQNSRIECYKQFAGHILSPRLVLEDGVIIGPNFTGFVADLVTLGRDTILAGNVTLVSENHGVNPESSIPYHAQPLTTGPIHIGEGCWIGQNVTVLPNVKIGDKVIIGAGSVVSHDIPSYCIAVGTPAKVIKQYNFSKHEWERYEAR